MGYLFDQDRLDRFEYLQIIFRNFIECVLEYLVHSSSDREKMLLQAEDWIYFWYLFQRMYPFYEIDLLSKNV
jgi:hypothetical protein